MTPAGIKPATFRIVAQHLKHCATTVPYISIVPFYILTMTNATSLYYKYNQSLILNWFQEQCNSNVMTSINSE